VRQVTDRAVTAFLNRVSYRDKNTYTDGECLYLHGNMIAWRHNGWVYATLANWPTMTTRERLNGLDQRLTGKRRFYQRHHQAYFDGTPIAANEIVRLA